MSDPDQDWNWELRLFCSADIVGSTAYKARKSPTAKPEWAATFSEFFRDFPDRVEQLYEELPEKFFPCQKKLSPWKFSGDEILFSVPIVNHREGLTHVWAFKQAVASFPATQWKAKETPLDLKATGWIAGFPVTNRKVRIPGSSGAVDFIGPSIDSGFRLTRFSTPRKFILSAALALLVLDGIHSCEPDSESKPHLFLDAVEPLKGVIDGKPYPIVFYDMNDGAEDAEEMLLGIKRHHDHDKLTDYLRKFLDDTPRLIRPFIEGDTHLKYNHIPPEISKLRDEMEAEETDRDYLLHGSDEGPATQGEAKKPPEPVKRDSSPTEDS